MSQLEESIRNLYDDPTWRTVSNLLGPSMPIAPVELSQRWQDYAKRKSEDGLDSAVYDLRPAEEAVLKLLSPTEQAMWSRIRIVQVPDFPLRARTIRQQDDTVLLISAPFILFLNFAARSWNRWIRATSGTANCLHLTARDHVEALVSLILSKALQMPSALMLGTHSDCYCKIDEKMTRLDDECASLQLIFVLLHELAHVHLGHLERDDLEYAARECAADSWALERIMPRITSGETASSLPLSVLMSEMYEWTRVKFAGASEEQLAVLTKRKHNLVCALNGRGLPPAGGAELELERSMHDILARLANSSVGIIDLLEEILHR